MMKSTIGAAPAPRSTFVSVLGWLAIACGALGIVATINQLVFFGAVAEAPIPNIEPLVQEGLFRFVSGAAVLNLALCVVLVYAGYALWKRRNWARRTFIVLFALGIAVNLIWVAFSVLLGSTFGQMAAAFGAFFVVFAILALAAAALFFWFIKRLRSPAVKNEFV